MVTMLINSELGLEDMHIAEAIKRDPLAQVLSVYHIRHEDGTVQFFNEPLSATLFGRVVIVTPDGLVPVERDIPLETIKRVRQTAKKRVFVTNSLRALASVSPTHNVRDIPFVVIVGGSALDFEIPQLVTDALSQYALVAGRGNIRGIEGAMKCGSNRIGIILCTEGRPMMDQSIVSKPTILLYATQHISADILKSVLYGIEEEGLPVVIEFHSGTHMTLADLASRNSGFICWDRR